MKIKMFKNKEKRKQFFILFFAILVGSIFLLEIVAFPLMYREPQTEIKTPEELGEKFSKQWIFEESLTEVEKEFLTQRGITIASYYYTEDSSFYELESIVETINSQKPQGQLILEKIKSEEVKIELNSLLDFIVVENLTQEEIFKGLCKTLYYPPADCTSFTE